MATAHSTRHIVRNTRRSFRINRRLSTTRLTPHLIPGEHQKAGETANVFRKTPILEGEFAMGATSLYGCKLGRRKFIAGGLGLISVGILSGRARADVKVIRISTPGTDTEWQSKALVAFK